MRGEDRAARLLPWLLILYTCASFLHFAHNAEFLSSYPNLPHSWTSAEVYLAWCVAAAVGLAGWLLYRARQRFTGLLLLALYAACGSQACCITSARPFIATRPA